MFVGRYRSHVGKVCYLCTVCAGRDGREDLPPASSPELGRDRLSSRSSGEFVADGISPLWTRSEMRPLGNRPASVLAARRTRAPGIFRVGNALTCRNVDRFVGETNPRGGSLVMLQCAEIAS
ncbi:hypothetical protein [Nocardia sp. MW-W600-9]